MQFIQWRAVERVRPYLLQIHADKLSLVVHSAHVHISVGTRERDSIPLAVFKDEHSVPVGSSVAAQGDDLSRIVDVGQKQRWTSVPFEAGREIQQELTLLVNKPVVLQRCVGRRVEPVVLANDATLCV